MDIRSSLEGLRTLLGVDPTATAATQGKNAQQPSASGQTTDRATLSSAGTEVSQSVSDSGVRMDKVVSVQQMLAAGTYNVPASEVASKLVDAMLSGQR